LLCASQPQEVVQQVYCANPTECQLIAQSDVFPEGFKPITTAKELLVVNKNEDGNLDYPFRYSEA